MRAGITILAAIALGSPLGAQITGLAGVVTSAAGQPVAGALVKIRCDSLGIAFTIVSQEQGRYSAPHLVPCKYEVQSFGGANQSPPAGPVDLSTGQQAKVDLILSAPLKLPALEK